jgi:hypothetical protein
VMADWDGFSLDKEPSLTFDGQPTSFIYQIGFINHGKPMVMDIWDNFSFGGLYSKNSCRNIFWRTIEAINHDR